MKTSCVCKIGVWVISLLIFNSSLWGQKFVQDKNYLKAEKLFYKTDYEEAIPILLRLDSIYDSPQIDYLIGMSYMEQKSMENEAIPYLESYVNQSDSLDQAHYYLAQLYHWNYHFDKAIAMYSVFEDIALSKTRDTIIRGIISETVEKRIAECNFGKASVSQPRKVIIENLGEEVNTKYPEYAPVITRDENTLIFTSRREGSTGGKRDQYGMYFEDIYRTSLLKGGLFREERLDSLLSGGGYITLVTDFLYSTPRPMWGNVNAKGHDGAIQFNPTEDSLYIYRDFDVWIADISDSLSDTKPQEVNFVNSSSFEPSVYQSYDGNIIYISSERAGGYGGLDLYESHKLPDGSWTIPKNLGPKINTPYDEDAPYIDPDGITLYFSSKGHSSMGGYDVFKSLRDPNSGWTDVLNMGYPVNTPGDDIYYVMTPKYNRAYYSSNNLKGYGDMDIYRLTFADERHPMAELKGLVLEDEDYRPAKSKITMLNEDKSVLSTFKSDSTSGKYLVLLGHGKEYDMLVETEGFLPYEKTFTIPEQRDYYQLYQEIHHIYIKDGDGNIIGQQIVVFNSFDDTPSSDTTSILFDDRTLSELERIQELRNGNQVDVFTDVKFYVSKDSLTAILQLDSTLKYSFPSNTSFSFLSGDKKDKAEADSYVEVSSEFAFDLIDRKNITLNDVQTASDLEANINTDNLENAPKIILYFEYDKTDMIDGENQKLNLLIEYLEKNKSVNVTIIGHTDGNGEEDYNQQLSEERANKIFQYLAKKGIKKSRMTAQGKGELHPIAPNTDEHGNDYPAGRQLNRRVEFTLH